MENRYLLIVEDEQDIADGIESLVEDLFTHIHKVASIEKAKSQLYQYTYDLIILDINLQGKNGAEIIKFLVDNPLNQNSKVPFILMSGMLSEDFVKKHSTKFSAIMAKPFDPDLMYQKVKDIVGVLHKTESIAKAALEEIPIVLVQSPFVIEDIQQKVVLALAHVKKKSKLRTLLCEQKIQRENDDYFLSHIGILINCCMAINQKLDWGGDKNLEKFLIAAYLHDSALRKSPELARYKNLEEIDNDQWELGIDRYNQAINHSETAYKSALLLDDLPQDVDGMIRMHHERPNGTGYPFKADYKKMSPLVSIFVAAHDLTDYIYDHKDWTLDDFISSRKKIYVGPNFGKILKALEELKNDLH